jgi:hypothetical protein
LDNNSRDYDQSNSFDNCEPNGDLDILHDNQRHYHEYVHCDGGYASYSSTYSWLPVGIDLGGTWARPAGRASGIPKSKSKQETPGITDVQTGHTPEHGKPYSPSRRDSYG